LNYIFSNVFENELDENGQPLDKVRIIFRDGNVFEGKLDKDGRHSVGKMMFIKGDVYDGEFKDGKLYRGKLTYINNTVLEGDFDENSQFCKGKKTQSDGIVLDGSWENNKPLDISVIAKLSKTGKAYCLFKRGKNNFQREIEYHLDGIDGHNRVMTIDYERINEILDGKGGEINNLDDLVKSEAINGVNNFNELKDFAKKMFQDRMSGEIKNGLEGLCIPLCDLLLLSSVDTVEQLKKTRFQHYTRKNEDSLRKDYGSLKDLLESVDINSIDEVEEDYLSLRIATIPTTHGISVILDIKKMKELKNLKPGRSLDEAVADKKVIHCFDSSRVLGANVGKKHNMGALTKNCDFVNLTQQELGSCWFHAMASTLTAMKYPELVQKIRNEKIELYDTEHKSIREGDKLNEFQLKQMNTIREISEKFNIGFIDDNREAIDLIIRSDVKEKVMEEPLRDVSEEVLGTKMVNVIKKMRDRLERSEIVPIQPIKTNLETVSARRKRETDFAHRVRITGEQDRTVKVLREDPEKSEKIILKELEAQRNFLTKNGKKRGIDDNVVHYGKGNEYDTLVSKLKKKRISSEMERQV
jgi:hypothetical protein